MIARLRSPRGRRPLIGGAVALALVSTTVRAQAPASRPFPYAQTISITPLLLPFGNFSAEYERKLGPPGLTFAIAGTYNTNTRIYPRRDRWANARLMFYPRGAALDGFAVGITAGAHHAERRYREDPTIVLPHDAGPTLGVLATYNYFYGPNRRVFFGPGFGIKRVLKSVAVNSPLSTTYFEGRGAVGIAF